MKGIVDEVREASQQQTQGIDQVTQAITQMEKVTQTTAATAEESAAASEELNAQAETSMGVVRELEALVGGRQPQVQSPAAHRAAGSAKVVKMAGAARAPKAPSAEDQLPLDGTGTYGRF